MKILPFALLAFFAIGCASDQQREDEMQREEELQMQEEELQRTGASEKDTTFSPYGD